MYVNIQLIRLGRVNEVVVENEDGGHTVFIDDQLSQEARLKAYRHAMRHIEDDDFGKHGDAGRIEREAHCPPGERKGKTAETVPRNSRRKNPERELRECQ